MKLTNGKLPKGFVLAKPIAQSGYDEAVIYNLERNDCLIIQRKRDGYKVIAVISKGEVRFYTVGLNEIDGRLDHIKKELLELKLPSGTIIVGECLIDESGRDNYTDFVSFFKSNGYKTNLNVKFMVFDLVLYGNKDLSEKTYSEILEMIARILKKPSLKYVFQAPVLNMIFDQAKELVRKNKWEGLVVRDKNFKNEYRLDGKPPKRPKGCYKWKPLLEDDFIAMRWRSDPDDPERAKDIVLQQINPKTGEQFDCAKIGSFTRAIREQLLEAKFPFVMEVEFEERFEKSGKLRNARFLRIRNDKPVHECIAPKNYPEAEYSREKVLGSCSKCRMTVDFYFDEHGWVCEKCGHWVDRVQ